MNVVQLPVSQNHILFPESGEELKEELKDDEEEYIDVKEELYRDVSPHQPEYQLQGKYEEMIPFILIISITFKY